MTSSTRPVQAPHQRPGGSRGGKVPVTPGRFGAVSRRQLYLAAIGVAALLAAVLVAISVLGGGGSTKKPGSIVGRAATTKLLAGIPQHGTTLGSPTAPYRLIEYADFQCPYCGDWARVVFPSVVKSFVRTGKVQIVFRGLDFVGPDSKTALITALGAASQNKFWNVADLLYRNQGTENTGWVSDSLVRGVLGGVPGLDVSRVLTERDGAAVANSRTTSARFAALAGVDQTPTFAIGPARGTLQPLTFGALDVPSFTKALKAAIGG